jgi:hypothetical protein
MVFLEVHFVQKSLESSIDFEALAPLLNKHNLALPGDGDASQGADKRPCPLRHSTVFNHYVGSLKRQPPFKVGLDGQSQNGTGRRIHRDFSVKWRTFAEDNRVGIDSQAANPAEKRGVSCGTR